MLRWLLLLLLLLLVGLAVTPRVRESWRPAAVAGPADSAGADLTLVPQGGDRRGRALADLPASLVPPLDSATRLTSRLKLGAEPDRHYLDSLLAASDSIVRHWPLHERQLRYAIITGGAAGFLPEMVYDVRWAIDTWSPAAIGLQWVEVGDTADAAMVIRWTDSLDAERAGFTDLTWDRAGRIRHAEVYLATRSPGTGRPLVPELRRAVALHEIGHALGLPHSPQTGDVMFPVAEVSAPTERDRFSLSLLYQLPTGWVGVTRPRLPAQ